MVTDGLTLIAGARRLEAAKCLGATVIEVRRVGDLTDQERTIIELEENLHRKHLTPIERSQGTVALGEAVGVHLRGQAIIQAGQGLQPNASEIVDTQTPVSLGPDAQLSNIDRQAVRRRPYQEKPDSEQKVATEHSPVPPSSGTSVTSDATSL